ncbi:MAG TPA: DUF502 domain-containing protein, partial [Planctomycetes bacterium]|nr:DUF502 domain-containing protein [Planctomycetota bacterium]
TVFNWIDGLIQPPAGGSWKIPLIGVELNGESFTRRGFGFLVTIAGIMLVGFLTSNVMTRWIVARIEKLFTQLPVIKQIYSSIKDMIEAFVSEEKKFDKPVLLSFTSEPDLEVIGFVTREDMAEFDCPDRVAVYVPQSYNFAANLIVVPRSRIRPIDLPAGDVMAFVVSGGVSNATRNLEAGENEAAASSD